MTPLIYLNDPKLYTISVALRSFSVPAGATDWGAIFAMSFLSLIPVFIIFILFQKYLVEGISTSGLRGCKSLPRATRIISLPKAFECGRRSAFFGNSSE